MKGVFLVRRKKGLIIDPSDICYEEECEEIGFEAPDEIKGNLVEGFSFTNEPVRFTHTAPNTTEKSWHKFSTYRTFSIRIICSSIRR